MLAHHTPGRTIEVLLYAITRQLLVCHGTSTDILLGVLAITLLFFTRKVLFIDDFGKDPKKEDLEYKFINWKRKYITKDTKVTETTREEQEDQPNKEKQ